MTALAVLQHSLGVDHFGRGRQYRNHFCAGPGHDDYDTCMELVALELMTRRAGTELTGGDDLFLVTDEGRAYVATNSPAPPKLTRSQQRYRQYLDAEANMPFGDWLKRSAFTPRADEVLF